MPTHFTVGSRNMRVKYSEGVGAGKTAPATSFFNRVPAISETFQKPKSDLCETVSEHCNRLRSIDIII